MKMSKKKTFGAPKSFVPPRKLFVGPKVFFHQDQGIVGCTPGHEAGPLPKTKLSEGNNDI